MHLMAIAKIVTIENIIIGVRIIDVESEEIKDIKLYELIRAIKENKVHIDNLYVRGDCLVGSVNKLPIIRNGKRTQIDCPITILSKLGKDGYKIAEYSGAISDLSNEEAYYYARHFGLSNGRVPYNKRNNNKRWKNYKEPDTREIIIPADGDYRVGIMSDESKKRIEERKEQLNKVNAKLKVLSESYIITPDFSIEVIDKSVTRLTVLSPISRLHKEAFSECEKLRKIKFPETFNFIDRDLFAGCRDLREVVMAKGTQVVKNWDRLHLGYINKNIKFIEE